MQNWKQQAEYFLKIADHYKLGKLPTETPHEKTKDLHDLSKSNLEKAISLLKEIDEDCISILSKRFSTLQVLHESIVDTLNNGGKVYLAGCGATGRLSLAIERIYLEKYPDKKNIISFMAGGDVALIQSLEEFEDHQDYGASQLEELGFSSNDLLIGSSEGGETPWVIGAIERATEISNRKPFFLYCNPDETLVENVERSRKVIENENIEKINLTCGPMALTGSTRMQASSILMLAIGCCVVLYEENFSSIQKSFSDFKLFYESLDIRWLSEYIKNEALLYQKNGYCLYQSHDHLGITILTDTTERSPTFNLTPFENQNTGTQEVHPSLCYFSEQNIGDNEKAWGALLGRKPRTLEWEKHRHNTSLEKLYGYDISNKIKRLRSNYLQGPQEVFIIEMKGNDLAFQFSLQTNLVKLSFHSLLYTHLVLKMILNIHSTLVMGRLDRYESNIMTWVRSSNNKLIDRTARNVQYLLRNVDIDIAYDQIIYRIFELKEQIDHEKSLVETVFQSLTQEKS